MLTNNVWLVDVVFWCLINYNVIIQKLHNLACNLNYDYENVGVFCFKYSWWWQLASGVAKKTI